MKKIKCISVGGNKSISVNTEYDLIEELENRYVIANNKGVQKNYSKKLFEEIIEEAVEPIQAGRPVQRRRQAAERRQAVEPVAQIPAPPVVVVPIIDEINVETSVDDSDEVDHLDISINFRFTQNNIFRINRSSILAYSESTISCGIKEIKNINNLMQSLIIAKRDFIDYVNQNRNSFTLNEDINIDELFKEIYSSLIQDIIAVFQGEENPKAGILLLSTNVSNNNDLNRDFIDRLELVASSTTEVVNPNSRNRIKLWTLTVE